LETSADIVDFRPKEAHNGTKPKSAPCTPCGNRDINFDVDVSTNFDHGAVTVNQVNCAASTPKLDRSVHRTPRADVSTQQRSLDRQRQRPAAVGCSPIELTSQLHQNNATNVYPAVTDHGWRHRRHRTRERNRSANR